MNSLVNIKDIEKRFGAQVLFSELSLSVDPGDRLAIIGPNGAGKSTLLKIIAQQESADSGSVILKQGARMSYVAQTSSFDEESTILDLALQSSRDSGIPETETMRLAYTSLAAMGLDDTETNVLSMSGGQKKRLQIALGLAQDPDLLLLDEPTNHLDIESILELEGFLSRANFAWAVVSHDRWFLENAVDRIVEINPSFPRAMFKCEGSYTEYLERKRDFLAAEAKSKDSLENKVRTEQAWLRQGAKARSTKSKKRTKDAYGMMDNLELVRARHREQKVQLQFTGSDRKTKKLAEFFSVEKRFGTTPVFSKLDLKLKAGQALGILGRNGSGKSTFVKLLCGELEPDAGTIKLADDIVISHFKQFSEPVDDSTTLKNYLSPDSDSIVHQGKEVHVVSWGRRFKFSFEQLQQPFSRLSGGEKARARIARLMLETPDILILDEPTNDLDIETLEMLEESLVAFAGVLVLVSHDRFMINRVCNSFLGLNGKGGSLLYADYEQWERQVLRGEVSGSVEKTSSSGKNAKKGTKSSGSSKKLSYKDQRDLNLMEKNIAKAESLVAKLQAKVAESTEAEDLQKACLELGEAQSSVEKLYERWAELEKMLEEA